MNHPLRYTEYAAPADVRPWVACIWSTRGVVHVERGHRVLPDGCVDWMLDLGAEQPWRLVGPMQQALQVPLAGQVDVLGIRFRPGGVHGILPLEVHTLIDGSVPLQSLASAALRTLPHAELGALAPQARVLRLWSWLRQSLHRAPCPITSAALHHWRSSSLSVAALAQDLGISTRMLQRRLLTHTGYTPAALRALARFRRALDVHARSSQPRWSTVALDAGYADQAHLCREFQRWAGATPQDWAATQAVASVQDGTLNWGQDASPALI